MDEKIEEVKKALEKFRELDRIYQARISMERNLAETAKEVCQLFEQPQTEAAVRIWNEDGTPGVATDANKPEPQGSVGCRIWSGPRDCPQYGSAECPATCSRFEEPYDERSYEEGYKCGREDEATGQYLLKPQDADLRENTITLAGTNTSSISGGRTYFQLHIVKPAEPQDDPRVQPVPLPDAIRLLAEWIAIDHDETRLQWEKYQTEAQELADYLHVIGFRKCPAKPWPVLPMDKIDALIRKNRNATNPLPYDQLITEAQRDADWKACHKLVPRPEVKSCI